MRYYYVYIMANASRMLYVGVTNDLRRRAYVHRQRLLRGYTSKYNLKTLVYYEATSSIRAAIAREKQIKGWLRKRKIALVESANPTWRDLSAEWLVPDGVDRGAAARWRQDSSPTAQNDIPGQR